jgi:hypothetical protein
VVGFFSLYCDARMSYVEIRALPIPAISPGEILDSYNSYWRQRCSTVQSIHTLRRLG